MAILFQCQKCDKSFKSARGLAGHKRMHGPSNGTCDFSKRNEENKKKREQKEQEYYQNPDLCLQCNSVLPFITVQYQKKSFCDHSCSTTYNNLKRGKHSEEWNKNISKGKRYYDKTKPKKLNIKKTMRQKTIYPHTQIKYCKCKHCMVLFISKSQIQYCPEHSNLYKSNNKNKYKFTFNVFDYPDLFDLKTIKEKGWHSHGGRYKYNPEGLTRDHKVSVNEAIRNDYDPYYIKHPLNCEIMSFLANNQKKTCSSITYIELVKQVDEYEKKNRENN